MTKMSYTVNDITTLIGVNRLTVRRWIDSGNLKALRDGNGKFYIRAADLEEFIVANPKYQKWMNRDEDRAFMNFCKEMLMDIYSMNAQMLGEEHGKVWNDGFEAALKEMELNLKNKIVEHDIPCEGKGKYYSKM